MGRLKTPITGPALLAGLRLCIVVWLAAALSGCLVMEGSAPTLERTDLLSSLPDYSGAYVSYHLDDSGRIEAALPESLQFFDRVADGVYRFAVQSAEDELPVFGGHLYLLDVGSQTEAVGIVSARSREGVTNVLFLRITRVSDQRFDVAGFLQNNTEKYEALAAVARRHGITLDPETNGRIMGQPTGRQLRSAYLDPDFLPNVETSPDYAFVLQDPEAKWPQQVEIRDYDSSGLAIIENNPRWQSTVKDGRCALEYGVPDEPAILAVHAIDGRLALQVRLPGGPDVRPDRVQLSWQVDTGRRQMLSTERPVLTPDTLVAFPLAPRLLEELARGSELSLGARGHQPLAVPLRGSARASADFVQCITR